MKERLSLKELVFLLKSSFSPFGAVIIKPPRGSKLQVETLSKGPETGEASIDRKGRARIPTGVSAKVTIEGEGQETVINVDDFRARPGHTPGARIRGEDIDVDLNLSFVEAYFSKIGHIKYDL